MIKQTLIRQPKTRIIHPSEREREEEGVQDDLGTLSGVEEEAAAWR
jgi:hypothetical protein